MKKVLLLKADDWAALYVDNIVVAQEHRIEPMKLLKLAEEHQFTHSDVADHWASPQDEEECMDQGCFPKYRSRLTGTYD